MILAANKASPALPFCPPCLHHMSVRICADSSNVTLHRYPKPSPLTCWPSSARDFSLLEGGTGDQRICTHNLGSIPTQPQSSLLLAPITDWHCLRVANAGVMPVHLHSLSSLTAVDCIGSLIAHLYTTRISSREIASPFQVQL